MLIPSFCSLESYDLTEKKLEDNSELRKYQFISVKLISDHC